MNPFLLFLASKSDVLVIPDRVVLATLSLGLNGDDGFGGFDIGSQALALHLSKRSFLWKDMQLVDSVGRASLS